MADDNQDLRAILDAAADTQGSNLFEIEDVPANGDNWEPFGPLAIGDGIHDDTRYLEGMIPTS